MYYPTEAVPVYPSLSSSAAVLAVMGCAIQSLSLLILTRPSFQQHDLTPYFLSVVLGNLMVIGADMPPLVASSWSGKQLVGIAYCQVQVCVLSKNRPFSKIWRPVAVVCDVS